MLSERYGTTLKIPSMINYNLGDVVLVPFPFTDQSEAKKRPAIVVSSQEYNDRLPDLILMAVTSQIKPVASYGEMNISQWKQAGLLKPSVTKPIFVTIEKGLVLRKLGRLGSKDIEGLVLTLQSLIGK
jgi:mRNA interferase MazF